jgi:hypothetical protein
MSMQHSFATLHRKYPNRMMRPRYSAAWPP